MPIALDIAGLKFGRLTAISLAGRDKFGKIRWLFQCECGNEHTACASLVRRGTTKSCGCAKEDAARENIKGARNLGKHNLHSVPEYPIWKTMRQRCSNPNCDDYPDYGGRGIAVCAEWNDFAAFYRDMGPRPTPKHTLDRSNNELGYSAANCRWATQTEQANNRRKRRNGNKLG